MHWLCVVIVWLLCWTESSQDSSLRYNPKSETTAKQIIANVQNMSSKHVQRRMYERKCKHTTNVIVQVEHAEDDDITEYEPTYRSIICDNCHRSGCDTIPFKVKQKAVFTRKFCTIT